MKNFFLKLKLRCLSIYLKNQCMKNEIFFMISRLKPKYFDAKYTYEYGF